MRCVSKSWNALLSESTFVKSHLHHSINNKDRILLFIPRGLSFEHSSINARPSHTPDLQRNNFIKLPVNPQFENSFVAVIGSVNGLICFYNKSYSCPSISSVVCIWNPCLSKVLTLPPCSYSYSDSIDFHFRFGFDPKTNDYKVVKLTSLDLNMLPEVEVYSMRKGSWEMITERFPSHITMIRDDDQVCVDGRDGHRYWLGSIGNLEWKLKSIVVFDLGADTFREIPLPHSIKDYRYNVVGVLGGKLCVMSMQSFGDFFEVWVMDEYGAADSWVEHHLLSQFGRDIIPFGITSHSEFLFIVNSKDDRFALYDPVAANAKRFQMPSRYEVDKIVEYVDNLVWVSPDDHEPTEGHLLISNLKRHRLFKGIQKATHQLHFLYLLLLLVCIAIMFLN